MTFTVDHAAALLAFCAAADDRFATADPATADARVRTWATILSTVDPAFALDHARRAYSKPRDRMLTPGEVRTAWANHQRVEDSRRRPVAAGNAAPSGPAPAGAAPTLWGYLKALGDAVAAGQDPTLVPRPRSARVMGRADDLRSRQCANWRNCSCSHERCRGGWLDVEETATNMLGLLYPVVKACPFCHDAASMAAQGIGPGATRGRRRS